MGCAANGALASSSWLWGELEPSRAGSRAGSGGAVSALLEPPKAASEEFEKLSQIIHEAAVASGNMDRLTDYVNHTAVKYSPTQLPHCIVVDRCGNVYVGEIGGKRIQRFVLQ